MKFFSTAILSLMIAGSSAGTAAKENGGNSNNLRQRQLRHNQRGRELTTTSESEYTHKVSIKVTNLAPEFGTCQSPVWIGIHDGRFDMFNQGSRASEGIEAMAEDGDPQYLSQQFAVTRGTIWEGNVGSARFCSGDVVELEDYFKIPATNAEGPYFFSYATMVLPSNDAFLANVSPRAYKITNAAGRPIQSVVTAIDLGTDVWDAGTEVNDEIPRNTGGLQPNVPKAGVEEWYKIVQHPGFNPRGSGGILDLDGYRNADFKNQPNYKMMKIEVKIEEVSSSHSGGNGMVGSNMIPSDMP